MPIALTIGRGTLRQIRQNLGWAIGYRSPAGVNVKDPVAVARRILHDHGERPGTE